MKSIQEFLKKVLKNVVIEALKEFSKKKNIWRNFSSSIHGIYSGENSGEIFAGSVEDILKKILEGIFEDNP